MRTLADVRGDAEDDEDDTDEDEDEPARHG